MNSSNDTLILTSNKKIVRINNKGDKIILDLDDMSIRTRLQDMYDKLDSYIANIRAAKNDEEQYKYSMEMSKTAVKVIDEIFGENTSIKLFGNNSPTLNLIYEFATKLSDLFIKYIKEKNSSIEKMVNISNKVNNNKYLRRKR